MKNIATRKNRSPRPLGTQAGLKPTFAHLYLLVYSLQTIGGINSDFCPPSSAVPPECAGEQHYCEGNCGLTYGEQVGSNTLRCSCDGDCTAYGDCCPDYVESCNATVDLGSSELINGGRCHQMYSSHPDRDGHFNLISGCHPDWQEKITRELCRNATASMTSLIPVTDLEASRSYANLHCAVCNFADSVQPWNVTVNCKDDLVNSTPDDLLTELELGQCGIVADWPRHDDSSFKPRACHPAVDACDERCENNEIILKCKEPVQEDIIVFSTAGKGYMRFKNRYCALCYIGSSNTTLVCGQGRNVSMGGTSRPTQELGDFSFPIVSGFDPSGCFLVSVGDKILEVSCETTMLTESETSTEPCSETDSQCAEAPPDLLDGPPPPPPPPPPLLWLGALSLACICSSILCLLARIALHPFIRSFHNLVGRNQLCLTFSILVAQIAFLPGPMIMPYKNVCIAAGLLMHWAFLASFLWMSAIAFDTWLVFRPASNFAIRSPGQQTRLFVKYSLFAWLVSIAVVASAYSLDLAEVDSSVRPYYGTRVCWIHQEYALVVFFGVPLILVIAVNTGLYIATARHLLSSLKTSKKVAQKSKDEHHFAIYVKLFLLMGATWAVAYVATFVDNAILLPVYTILNASQGLFTSLSSLCTRRVYRDLFRKKSYAASSADRSSGNSRSTRVDGKSQGSGVSATAAD